MFVKRIKNNDTIPRTWVGQTIAPGTYYSIQAFEEVRWANDSQLLTDIGATKAVVNDNTQDIADVSLAINYLKGSVSPVLKITHNFVTTGFSPVIPSPMLFPLRYFTLSVVVTGVVTAWNVALEGSLDGTNFTTIMKHDNTTKSGATVFPGTNVTPCLYLRINCTGLTIGVGGSIDVTAIGSP